MKKEKNENRSEAYEEVNEMDLPEDANIVSSHAIFRTKKEEDGNLRLKGYIVDHGNRDADKVHMRSD